MQMLAVTYRTARRSFAANQTVSNCCTKLLHQTRVDLTLRRKRNAPRRQPPTFLTESTQRTCAETRARTHARTRAPARTFAHAHTQIPINTRACVHKYIQTHTRTHSSFYTQIVRTEAVGFHARGGQPVAAATVGGCHTPLATVGGCLTKKEPRKKLKRVKLLHQLLHPS